jgi:large conductance mechanosensitive channel
LAEHRIKIAKLKKRLPFWDEFKKFILRGNVVDLAVGVIIGGAFNKIVTSLVNDVLLPLLSVIIGENSLDSRFIALDGNHYATLEAAGSTPLIKYGSFIATVLDFLLMGIVIFALMKMLNFLHDKLLKEKDGAADTIKERACPFCMMKIHIDATVCPYCTRDIILAAPDSHTTGAAPPP